MLGIGPHSSFLFGAGIHCFNCFQFLPCDAILVTVFDLLVCLSVCLSQVSVLLKRLNVGS